MEIINSAVSVSNGSVSKVQQNQLAVSEQTPQGEFVDSRASMAARAYAAPQIKPFNKVSFEGRYEKMVNMITTAHNPSKVQLRYDEACCILEHLGYQIRHTNGSHVVASIPNGQALTFVYPHGHQKFVHPATISDLKGILINSHAV